VAVAAHEMFALHHGNNASVHNNCKCISRCPRVTAGDIGCSNFGYSCRSQEIDMFGEISGVCFSPQADKFFVGIADATYSSLLQFNRHEHQSLQQHGSL